MLSLKIYGEVLLKLWSKASLLYNWHQLLVKCIPTPYFSYSSDNDSSWWCSHKEASYSHENVLLLVVGSFEHFTTASMAYDGWELLKSAWWSVHIKTGSSLLSTEVHYFQGRSFCLGLLWWHAWKSSFLLSRTAWVLQTKIKWVLVDVKWVINQCHCGLAGCS